MRIFAIACIALMMCIGCAEDDTAGSVDDCEAVDDSGGADHGEAADLYDDATETSVDMSEDVTSA